MAKLSVFKIDDRITSPRDRIQILRYKSRKLLARKHSGNMTAAEVEALADLDAQIAELRGLPG